MLAIGTSEMPVRWARRCVGSDQQFVQLTNRSITPAPRLRAVAARCVAAIAAEVPDRELERSCQVCLGSLASCVLGACRRSGRHSKRIMLKITAFALTALAAIADTARSA